MISIEILRQYRITEYAIFDLVVSFLGMYLLSPLLTLLFRKIRVTIPKINWVYLTLPIGIIAHLLFGTLTPMTKHFFDPSSHYILKIIIIGSLILGFRGIRIIRKG